MSHAIAARGRPRNRRCRSSPHFAQALLQFSRFQRNQFSSASFVCTAALRRTNVPIHRAWRWHAAPVFKGALRSGDFLCGGFLGVALQCSQRRAVDGERAVRSLPACLDKSTPSWERRSLACMATRIGRNNGPQGAGGVFSPVLGTWRRGDDLTTGCTISTLRRLIQITQRSPATTFRPEVSKGICEDARYPRANGCKPSATGYTESAQARTVA